MAFFMDVWRKDLENERLIEREERSKAFWNGGLEKEIKETLEMLNGRIDAMALDAEYDIWAIAQKVIRKIKYKPRKVKNS